MILSIIDLVISIIELCISINNRHKTNDKVVKKKEKIYNKNDNTRFECFEPVQWHDTLRGLYLRTNNNELIGRDPEKESLDEYLAKLCIRTDPDCF